MQKQEEIRNRISKNGFTLITVAMKASERLHHV